MSSIAVLIPSYNEEKTIKKVVEDFKTALPEATIYSILYYPVIPIRIGGLPTVHK